MEQREVGRALRARSSGPRPGVTLHAIAPGVVDDYGSLWSAHAFDSSLARRLPVLCWSHQWEEPLGPAIGYRTGPNGPEIDFEFSDFDAVPMARRAYAQVKDGTIADCSVGFSNAIKRLPTQAEQRMFPDALEVIDEADLDEVSLVLRGAVPGAKVLAVRKAPRASAVDAVLSVIRRKAPAPAELDDTLKHALDLIVTRDGWGDKRVALDARHAGGDVDPLLQEAADWWDHEERRRKALRSETAMSDELARQSTAGVPATNGQRVSYLHLPIKW